MPPLPMGEGWGEGNKIVTKSRKRTVEIYEEGEWVRDVVGEWSALIFLIIKLNA